jgi:D-3-phosphoglycerate dehydrogenase
MKILVTSTSFQDTKGQHHDLLKSKGFDLDFKRGPLSESELLSLNWDYTGIIMGDDEYTRNVLIRATSGGLKILSKYGVGLDKVDLVAAKELDITVKNCPGLNHTTVSEHVFALLLAFTKNIVKESQFTKDGNWKRLTGKEITGKNIAIIGLGKIGKEVARIARCFSMNISAYDKFIDKEFVKKNGIHVISDLTKDLKDIDIISLHCNLDDQSKNLISAEVLLKGTRNDVILINTARAHLVDRVALLMALEQNEIGGYLADVWFEEPMKPNDPLKDFENVLITPHIASRTYDNVEKQGIMAIENLCNGLGV